MFPVTEAICDDTCIGASPGGVFKPQPWRVPRAFACSSLNGVREGLELETHKPTAADRADFQIGKGVTNTSLFEGFVLFSTALWA